MRNVKNEVVDRKCAELNVHFSFSRSKQARRVTGELRKEENHKINFNLIKMNNFTKYYSLLLQNHRVEFLEEDYNYENSL